MLKSHRDKISLQIRKSGSTQEDIAVFHTHSAVNCFEESPVKAVAHACPSMHGREVGFGGTSRVLD